MLSIIYVVWEGLDFMYYLIMGNIVTIIIVDFEVSSVYCFANLVQKKSKFQF